MFHNNPIVKLLNIRYPIIQGGMVYCCDWKLASTVSNSGCLGTIAAGHLSSGELIDNIIKCKESTNYPFAVNVPLITHNAEEKIKICIDYKVPVVITSAGSPTKFTSLLKKNNITVLHVVSNLKFAQKAKEAGVDAIIAEGVEAGGHNGKDELTTFILTPLLAQKINLPIVSAGGIATGKQMLAAMILGASGVQIGTLFIATEESSAHPNFKQKIIEANDESTQLCLKKITPTRLLKNKFYYQIIELENNYDTEQFKKIIENKSKLGMYLGDVDNGMLEVGQNVCLINEILPTQIVIQNILNEFFNELSLLKNIFDCF